MVIMPRRAGPQNCSDDGGQYCDGASRQTPVDCEIPSLELAIRVISRTAGIHELEQQP